MATWQQFEREAPDLAAEVRRVLTAQVSHVLATVRRDGSPRVSGTEVAFDGSELTIGSMLGAMKAQDLLRDGRFALHSCPGPDGDAKLSGVAVVDGTVSEHHKFQLDLRQAVLTGIGDDGKHLLIQVWRPGREVERIKRY
jgi:hypothetical protein